ncbi:MAG: transcription initiation factor TFIIIB [Clostridium sp.]|uniref:transcription initiation factor TFIIIB n=1 Tax=Clostridium sp. TaxID=1506 RepID=UPI003D6DA6D8
MEVEKKCPECGCKKIAQAKLDINAKLYPIDALLKIMNGSQVSAEVCTKCGYILNMRALAPEKLK